MSVDKVSAEIMRIRNEARARLGAGPVDYCPTCGNSMYSPYRVYDDRQHVAYGCVDAYHTGHLVPTSESNRWQNGKEAQILRKRELAHLKSLVLKPKKLRRAPPIGSDVHVSDEQFEINEKLRSAARKTEWARMLKRAGQ